MSDCICPKCKRDLSSEAAEKCREEEGQTPTLVTEGSATTPKTVVVFCENGHDSIAVECECS